MYRVTIWRLVHLRVTVDAWLTGREGYELVFVFIETFSLRIFSTVLSKAFDRIIAIKILA